MTRKTTGFAALVLLCSCVITCAPHKLRPDEIERNRLFSEIVKRSDRRTIGDDDFFQRNLRFASSAQVAEWCAIALGRIGDPRALPWLYEAMENDTAALRAAAVFAVGEIEDGENLRQQALDRAPDAVARVRRLVDDGATTVQMRAIEALGKIGDAAAAPAVVHRMRATPVDRSPVSRAILSLGITASMRLRNADEYGVLRSLAASPDHELQSRALDALFRLRDQGACPVFRAGLRSADADVRAHAARGLGQCAPSDAATLAPFLQDLSQPLSVRVCAVRALGQLREAAVVPSIARALASERPDGGQPEHVNFSAEAAAALGEIGAVEAVPVLCELLDSEGASRDAALVALAKVLRFTPDRFFEVTRGKEFETPAARRAWVRALGELGDGHALQELRAILADALEHPGTGVRLIPTLIESLSAAHTPELFEIASSLLGYQDGPVLRAAAAAYVPGGAASKAWQRIADAYAAICSGADAETKTALLNALQPWAHEPGAISVLERALHDRSRNARIAAARLLRLAGHPGVPQDPGPAESTLSDLSYDLAASARKERTVALIGTDRGEIQIELFREDAPLTVANFVQLARSGFYNGLTFMRVVPYFVIQGGDPRNDQEGGPGYSIRCEINMRPFERGSLGMALAGKDTGGSQFFITLAPQPHLDGGYTCFGRVIAGMSVAEHITAGDRIRSVRITDDVTMLDFRRF